jgi:peroxiredoxin Q/BCP
MSFPKVGNLAPSFTLLDQDGNKVSLKDFKGESIVVLYFYPKAMTPGCTTQACGLRDSKKALDKEGVVVLGVSPDEPKRLVKFIEKEKLNFTLLSDPDNEIAKKYGAFGRKKFMGKEYDGILRTTFIIGADGKLKHVMDKVNTKTHHDDVKEILKTLE